MSICKIIGTQWKHAISSAIWLNLELENQGIKKPIRMMIIGGAYMLLLENAPRPTEDIDIFWLAEDVFERMRETVSACMLEIARTHALPPNWFNFLTQVIMMHDIFIPDGTLWKRFGPLHIYIPPRVIWRIMCQDFLFPKANLTEVDQSAEKRPPIPILPLCAFGCN